MSVTAVVGAQYGSEGKGAIVAAVADRYDIFVRTGAPNAGHTFYYDKVAGDGTVLGRQKFVARSIPCGWVNRHATMVIGAGAMIDLDNLLEEIQLIEAAGYSIKGRLLVDRKAMVIDPLRHHAYEGGIAGKAHEKIGSTGEGVGIARMAKISRGVLVADLAWGQIAQCGDDAILEALTDAGAWVTDTTTWLNDEIDCGQRVMLEGTQGSGLSLVHGPWPYVTSTDTNSGQLCVDAGVSPRLLDSTILVARTYPIRVAGNSGPLQEELTWDEVGVAPETTTVTKKVRRVGRWDHELVERAIMLNRPCVMAVTFADYDHPELFGCTEWDALSSLPIIEHISVDNDTEVVMVGTGPDSVAISPEFGR